MILILHERKEVRDRVQFAFYHLGLNTVASSRARMEKFLDAFPVRAVYLPEADTIPGLVPLCRKLRKEHPLIPVIPAVTPEKAAVIGKELAACTASVLKVPIPPLQAAAVILEHCRLIDGRDLSDLREGVLGVNLYTDDLYFCSIPCPATAVECSVARYILEQAPRAVSDTELALSTGNPLKRRKEACVRTYVSRINRLAMQMIRRPAILHIQKEGYFPAPFDFEEGTERQHRVKDRPKKRKAETP